MIANDDLAYKTCHSWCPYLAAFTMLCIRKIIVSRYVMYYTFGKIYDWPIQIHVNE